MSFYNNVNNMSFYNSVNNMKHLRTTSLAFLFAGLFVLTVSTSDTAQATNCKNKNQPHGVTAAAAGDAHKHGLKPQSTCPVSGNAINKEVFTDTAGYRIYACCSGCLAKIEADPGEAVATLLSRGETPESRLVVCTKCGGIKGTTLCCSPDAVKCDKCGLHKGSVGCCRDLEPAAGEKDVVICSKCGEVAGTGSCCQPGVATCPKCQMHKGAPGCCKTESIKKK